MSYIKTASQIAHIRVSCQIAAEILQELIDCAKPGVTTLEIDHLAERLTKRHKVVPSFKGYLNYPHATCISVNDEVVHGLPGKRTLKKGDVVGIDFGVRYRGYFSDVARTVAIGTVSADAQRLIRVTKTSLKKAIEQVKPGRTIGDIGHAVQTYVEEAGMGVVRDLVGHGVGTAVHEPPAIPNYGSAGDGVQLVPGMVIALEPMVTLGKHPVALKDDGWTFVTKDGSLAAHFEDTILVTERGHEVLTSL
ncbi:MAG: type I methionyl aminopeptidase [Candidatus Andersenbacteria bacterium]